MDGMKPPEPLSVHGNVSENWRRWRQRFELYLTASGLDRKDKKVQRCTLLHIIGEDALEIFNTFQFAADEPDELSSLLQKFASHFEPQTNVTYERHVFNTRVQMAGETIDQFVTDLKTKAKSCAFESLNDSLIKDRIVVGIQDDGTRARLLRERDLTLEKAVDICRAAETSKMHVNKLTAAVADKSIQQVTQTNQNRWKQAQRKCTRCNYVHNNRPCPAVGKTCSKCGKPNHFAAVCKSMSRQQVHEVHDEEHSSVQEDEDFHLDIVEAHQCKSNAWFVTLFLEGCKVQLKIDTGAQCNVLPKSISDKLKVRIHRSTTKLITYSGEKLKPAGRCTVLGQYNGKFHCLEFQIMPTNVTPVLGLESCVQMGLVKRLDALECNVDSDVLQQYDVFDGLGCLEGEHHIHVKPDAQPIVHPPRRVPVALRDKVKTELERMERLGVIVKQEEPTPWVNSMVVVAKKNSDKVRICLDPKHLNDAIQRAHYPMKTVEEVVAKMPGAQFFSTLDANCGYWQLKLDEQSSMLCTFNTPYGRYRYTRMPFGVNAAPEIFQRTMNQILEGLDGVEVIMDDILVWGVTEEEHDQRLELVLQRVEQKNLKLNTSICRFKVNNVTYIGHVLSAEGVRPDPRKVEAVRGMKIPTNKTELQRFLGTVNYLGKFIPNLATETAPLRILLAKDIVWHWQPEQNRAFDRLKLLVTQAPVLQYFDVNKPVVVSADASKDGVGAVLLQEDMPVAYASRALTQTQCRYAQIEKELYAVTFACDKFHQYLFGREFQVETDHKPLESIVTKPLAETPSRLQRMLLKLQKYQMTVHYKPGKDLVIADTLSRSYLPHVGNDSNLDNELPICMVTCLPMSPTRISELQSATKNDEVLQKLGDAIHSGWPENRSLVPQELVPFWDYRDVLVSEDGLIFKGNRVVIPARLRSFMLSKIHESHQGIEKSKRLARDIMFWPGMSQQIADVVSRCPTCSTFKRKNQKEPMIGHEIPIRPWQKIGTDLFEIGNDNFIVLVDYFSNFIEVKKLSTTKSAAIITYCKEQFARYGIPDEIVSDNGPQYTSFEFCQFMILRPYST